MARMPRDPSGLTLGRNPRHGAIQFHAHNIRTLAVFRADFSEVHAEFEAHQQQVAVR